MASSPRSSPPRRLAGGVAWGYVGLDGKWHVVRGVEAPLDDHRTNVDLMEQPHARSKLSTHVSAWLVGDVASPRRAARLPPVSSSGKRPSPPRARRSTRPAAATARKRAGARGGARRRRAKQARRGDLLPMARLQASDTPDRTLGHAGFVDWLTATYNSVHRRGRDATMAGLDPVATRMHVQAPSTSLQTRRRAVASSASDAPAYAPVSIGADGAPAPLGYFGSVGMFTKANSAAQAVDTSVVESGSHRTPATDAAPTRAAPTDRANDVAVTAVSAAQTSTEKSAEDEAASRRRFNDTVAAMEAASDLNEVLALFSAMMRRPAVSELTVPELPDLATAAAAERGTDGMLPSRARVAMREAAAHSVEAEQLEQGRARARRAAGVEVGKSKYHEFEDAGWARRRDAELGREGAPPVFKLPFPDGQFADVADALRARGWVRNEVADGSTFNLLWTLRDTDISWDALRPDQWVNHFEGARALTTKSGLCRSMRNLGWAEAAESRTFFPRCYELGSSVDADEFVHDFRTTAACSVLRRHVAHPQAWARRWGAHPRGFRALSSAVAAMEASVMPHIDEDTWLMEESDKPPLSDERWQELLDVARDLHDADGAAGPIVHEPEFHESGVSESDSRKGRFVGQAALTARARRVLKNVSQLEQHRHSWFADGVANAWIVKSGEGSKGMGVEIHRSLDALMALKGHGRVVQKYIERPLLIGGHKSDIRVFVLVTSWAPLQAHVFGQAYLRFSCKPYSMAATSLGDRLAHLCNYAVQRSAIRNTVMRSAADSMDASREDRDTSSLGEAGFSAEALAHAGNVWSQQRFVRYLQAEAGVGRGRQMWAERVQPAIDRAVVGVLRSATPHITQRERSFELFGLDFVLDGQLRPFLLEVNLSPALNHRTPVLTQLYARMMSQLLRIVIDGKGDSLHPTADPVLVDPERAVWRLVVDERRSAISVAGESGAGGASGLSVAGKAFTSLHQRFACKYDDWERRCTAAVQIQRVSRGRMGRRKARQRREARSRR